MHTCTGCDTLTTRDRLWHGLYVAWYDHAALGHVRRARVYGWAADQMVRRA